MLFETPPCPEIGRRTIWHNDIAAMLRVVGAARVRLVFDKKGAAGILRRDAEADLSDDLST
jgi:hypothetical protein